MEVVVAADVRVQRIVVAVGVSPDGPGRIGVPCVARWDMNRRATAMRTQVVRLAMCALQNTKNRRRAARAVRAQLALRFARLVIPVHVATRAVMVPYVRGAWGIACGVVRWRACGIVRWRAGRIARRGSGRPRWRAGRIARW